MTRTRPGATEKNSSTQLDKTRPGMSVKAPRRQRGAGGAGPRGQGPLPAAGGPVPGPDGGLGHHRGGSGRPLEGPGGPGPVQGQKNQLQLQPGLVVASHPGIVAPAAGVRKAPGLPPPGRCRPAGPGRQYSGPALAAGGRHRLPTGRRSEGQAHRSAGRRAGRSPGQGGLPRQAQTRPHAPSVTTTIEIFRLVRWPRTFTGSADTLR